MGEPDEVLPAGSGSGSALVPVPTAVPEAGAGSAAVPRPMRSGPHDATTDVQAPVPRAGSTVHAGGPVGGPVPLDRRTLVCPSCGAETRDVTMTKRQATDFCRECDYPLFWTPTEIVTEVSSGDDDSALRRLPGVGGRLEDVSVPCPHCGEANRLVATVCARCGWPMVVVATAPVVVRPAPVVVIEQEPEPERTPWWIWAVLGVTAVLLVVLILVLVLT